MPASVALLVRRVERLRIRLDQLATLHADEYMAMNDPAAERTGWRRFYALSLVLFCSGFLLVTLLGRRLARIIRERRRAVVALRRSEALLAQAQRLAHIGHWDLSIADDTAVWSDEAHRICGAATGALDGSFDQILEVVVAGDRERLLRSIESAIAGEGACEIDVRVVRPDGTERTVHAQGVVVSEAGRPVRVVGAIQDITDRMRAETRERLLRCELDHRVRNNLSAIASLAHQAGSTAETASACGDSIVGRVNAMAAAHAVLADEIGAAVDLERLLGVTFAALAPHEPDRLRMDGPAIEVRAASATPLALVVHELAMNAVKHGAWSVPGGRVDIRWEGDEDALRLTWTEHGGRFVEGGAETGTGIALIEGLIRHDLRGSVRRHVYSGALHWQLELPITPAETARNVDQPQWITPDIVSRPKRAKAFPAR
ncbi:MAG: PAS domain-containing protein [Planctomycetes bacterium]|nr:PAS domain-containing protein [Planctomycetota bacterium]